MPPAPSPSTAAASPTLAPLVAGIGEADSWATDAHKWLNVPYDSGVAFVRDASKPGERTPLELSSRVESLCDEILGLTKMNWNNTPCTLNTTSDSCDSRPSP